MTYTLDDYDPDSPDEFDGWYTDATGERIRERLSDRCARTVLEIGCATGRMTEILGRTRGGSGRRRILACTLDEGMATRARARQLEGVSVVRGDVLHMQNMTFEAVVCCSVLHEAPNPRAILEKAHDLLAPRGRVFVTVPNADSVHRSSQPHVISERGDRYGVRRLMGMDAWHSLLITGTGLRVVDRGAFILKPYENARMEQLDEHVLAFLATYRGPGGAICYFELESA